EVAGFDIAGLKLPVISLAWAASLQSRSDALGGLHRRAVTIEARGRYPSRRRTQPLIHAAAMIEHYSDHAANQRTFLAWVRTAIAIWAFGFLVEKFDLFLRLAGASHLGEAVAGASGAMRTVAGGSQFVGDAAGLLLILLGGAMMAFAAIRFAKTAR